jgi:hypothetical protein
MKAALLNRLWGLACAGAARRFAGALDHPGEFQRAHLAKLLNKNRETAFGREHGFGSMRRADDFRQHVPVRSWSEFAPWMERLHRGEDAVLTRDRVKRLIPTGGSTGGVKLIPWTAGLAGEFRTGISAWLTDLQRCFPGVLGGSAYWSISPLADDQDVAGVFPIGFDDDCSYLGGCLAAVVRPLLAAPSVIRRITDVNAFRYTTMRCLLADRSLRLISVWHPSFLSLLFDAALDHRERLIADIGNGTLSASVPDEVRSAMRAWLRPDLERAEELSDLDWREPRALWPDLSVVSCWGDGAAQVPCAALTRRLRGIPVQRKGLLATEGIISLPWENKSVAALTSHVLEFMDDSGECRWIDELEDGATYEVVVTTGGGLWRYRLGDLVRIDGFARRTPCLRFIGRSGVSCDLVGEKLDEGFVSSCIAQVLDNASFALLAPNSDDSIGYTLFADAPMDREVLLRLDAALSVNPQWRLARRLQQLAPLRGRQVSPKAQRIWLEHRAGHCIGAVKPSSLDADRQWEQRFAAVVENACG